MIRQQSRNVLPGALLAATALSLSGVAQGAEWQTGGGISVGAIYTDNECLDADDRQDKLFATWTPSVRASADGARASFDLYAAVQYNSWDSDNHEQCSGRGNALSPAPRIRFRGDSELIENWLYLDASVFGGVNRANPFAVGGADSVDDGNNLNRTYRYAVSPYLYRRIGDTASLLARYRYSETNNSKNTINDRQMDEFMADLGTDPALARFSYGVAGDYSKVHYDGRENGGSLFNSELSSARVRAAFQLNSSWQINGYVGREWNDFISLYSNVDGTIWDVGATWTPNPRIRVEAGVGERFFGSAPRFSVEYHHKRSFLSASYSRILTYDSSVRTTDFFGDGLDDLFDDGVVDDDIVVGIGGLDTTVTNSPIVDKRTLVSYRLTGQRSTFTLRGSYSQQLRTEDRLEDEFTYVAANLSHRITRNVTGFVRASWHRRQPDSRRGQTIDRDSDLYRYTLGADYSFGPHTDVVLSYDYSDRDSDRTAEEYRENRVSMQFRYRF